MRERDSGPTGREIEGAAKVRETRMLRGELGSAEVIRFGNDPLLVPRIKFAAFHVQICVGWRRGDLRVQTIQGSLDFRMRPCLHCAGEGKNHGGANHAPS